MYHTTTWYVIEVLKISLMVHAHFNTSVHQMLSGLDASSSLELLNHLNLVAESGRMVILTIHQPRLEIFHLFHKIILLYDGQVTEPVKTAHDCINMHQHGASIGGLQPLLS